MRKLFPPLPLQNTSLLNSWVVQHGQQFDRYLADRDRVLGLLIQRHAREGGHLRRLAKNDSRPSHRIGVQTRADLENFAPEGQSEAILCVGVVRVGPDAADWIDVTGGRLQNQANESEQTQDQPPSGIDVIRRPLPVL